ncbi:MAG: hypothetical protein IBJ03_04580 [Gemmatimonadaceae bacterium]|nr:hypothetical protein [Gemmatimonadaceae bacterium]
MPLLSFLRRCTTLAVVLGVALPLQDASAQIRGRSPTSMPPRQSGAPRWWFSGGAAGVVMGDINDGATQSTWTFGSDPLWQLRGSIEKALAGGSSLGVTAGYGLVDVTLTPFLPQQLPETPDSPCMNGCEANVELWTMMGQFRSGGGPGFHSVFEAQGGITGFRNLKTRDSTAVSIGPKTQQFDLSGALGFGFGYTLSSGFQVALVQDFGMGWHSKTDLPSSFNRTWRIRNTRASLRFAF